MNKIFKSFLFVFYLPILDLSLGVTQCGKLSIMSKYKNTEECNIFPNSLKVIGILVFIITFMIGLTVVYILRSNRF